MFDLMLTITRTMPKISEVADRLNVKLDDYILLTLHRAENTDEPTNLTAIIRAMVEVSRKWDVVLPLHPRTKLALERNNLLELANKNFSILPPVGYLEMATLLQNCILVATDSGGLQKEAFFWRKPCFTLRQETEWLELIEGGWNHLVPPGDPVMMANSIRDLSIFLGETCRLLGMVTRQGKSFRRLMNTAI